MRYQILIYNNPAFDDALENGLRDELDATHGAVIRELQASGELIETNELSTEAAVVVRTDSHKRVHTTDGPFIEAKEWVGGFYLVDCASIDRAVEIAGRFVEARFSPVEVRQLVHEPS
ncbi:YciI family protein [Diaminobutyricibacter sp. McL0608]|uniref:YciI family protein n=1 Tax=Leifsonia sp. McL0608 TaxID=3143537 RepID=UPI0031F31EA3